VIDVGIFRKVEPVVIKKTKVAEVEWVGIPVKSRVVDVDKLLLDYANGMSRKDIAKKYGITESAVGQIIRKSEGKYKIKNVKGVKVVKPKEKVKMDYVPEVEGLPAKEVETYSIIRQVFQSLPDEFKEGLKLDFVKTQTRIRLGINKIFVPSIKKMKKAFELSEYGVKRIYDKHLRLKIVEWLSGKLKLIEKEDIEKLYRGMIKEREKYLKLFGQYGLSTSENFIKELGRLYWVEREKLQKVVPEEVYKWVEDVLFRGKLKKVVVPKKDILRIPIPVKEVVKKKPKIPKEVKAPEFMVSYGTVSKIMREIRQKVPISEIAEKFGYDEREVRWIVQKYRYNIVKMTKTKIVIEDFIGFKRRTFKLKKVKREERMYFREGVETVIIGTEDEVRMVAECLEELSDEVLVKVKDISVEDMFEVFGWAFPEEGSIRITSKLLRKKLPKGVFGGYHDEKQSMMHTIYHEIGHLIYDDLSEGEKDTIIRIASAMYEYHQKGEYKKVVSDYGVTGGVQECFCELVGAYMVDKERMKGALTDIQMREFEAIMKKYFLR
jgi:predicted transcriptional regulator